MSSENLYAQAAEAAKKPFDRMDLVFTVLQRGLGDRVVEINKEQGVYVNFICPGRGTATTSILDMFGLGATEKDIVLSCVKSESVPAVLKKIAEKLEFDKPGTGVSFAVPMQSVAGSKVLHYFTTASFGEDQSNGR